MKKTIAALLLTGAVCFAAAGDMPLAKLWKYNGTFIWIKVPAVPKASLATLSKAKSIVLGMTLTKDAVLKKDKNGNTWFTCIVADQDSAWKWTQTKGNGPFPVSGGKVKAGKYTVVVPVEGIPAKALAGREQHFSVGVGTSGMTGLIDVEVNSIRGK